MKKFSGALTVLGFLLTSVLAPSYVLGSDIYPVPHIEDCVEENSKPDWNYGYGTHTVAGWSDPVVGTNEVFRASRGYVQCVCTGNSNSVQAHWWRMDDYIDQGTIDFYLSQGWVLLGKPEWDTLLPGEESKDYLVKHSTYSCTDSSLPTPTPTGTQVTLSPTPTVTPTPKPGSSSTSHNGGGGGNPGAPVCTDSVLSAPVLVTVSRSSSDSVDLAWTGVSEATDYMISYGLESGNYIYGVPSTGNVTNFRVGGLDLNKHYYFQVRAIKGCMPGEASNELAYPQSTGQVLGLAATSGIGLWAYASTALSGVGVMAWMGRRYAQKGQ